MSRNDWTLKRDTAVAQLLAAQSDQTIDSLVGTLGADPVGL